MASKPREFDADFLAHAPQRSKVRTRHQKAMRLAALRPAQRPFVHTALVAEVSIRAPVFATEDAEAVARAVTALFPDASFEEVPQGGAVQARARDLSRLAEIVRLSRIRDAAREVLKHSIDGDGVIRLRLNKQAATAARVNFVSGRETLGEIEVEIRASEPDFLAEELTWIERESDERLLGARVRDFGQRRPK